MPFDSFIANPANYNQLEARSIVTPGVKTMYQGAKLENWQIGDPIYGDSRIGTIVLAVTDNDSPALLVGKHVPAETGKREVAIYKALEKMKVPTTYRTVLRDSMELDGDNEGKMILFGHPRGVGTLESDVVQTMTKDEKKVLMHQYALANAAMHKAGFINRDIKESNALLVESNVPGNSRKLYKAVLCDVDMARSNSTGGPETNDRLRTTLKWGTVAYHAPEMGAVSGWYNGRQADVFAIGVCFHFLS